MIKLEDFYPLLLDSFEKGKTFTFPVQGTSMQPFFHSNDVVELAPMTQIKKGDIVLYRRTNGQFVLHRVRHIRKDQITFVGDHQYHVEKGIVFQQCIGKVISYKKQGKDKQFQLKGVKYRIYSWLIRCPFLRGVFGKLL